MAQGAIKAIETRYKGYRFRSRLEARWAVFFDALGVEWEYEPEGFDMGEAGWYLPDFWLPAFGFFVEVKPNEDNFFNLPCAVLRRTVLVMGVPSSDVRTYDFVYEGDITLCADLGVWGHCTCGKPLFGYRCNGEFSGYLSCNCNNDSLEYDKTVNAAIAARSARFEHGETPR